MKNFWTLFRYEMKKIWKRPLLWIVLALCVGFLVNETRPHLYDDRGITYTAIGKDGSEISRYLTFREEFQIEREAAHLLDGQKMDEAFFETMREAMPDPAELTPDFSMDDYILLEAPAYSSLRYLHEYTAEAYYSIRSGVRNYLRNSEELTEYMDLTDEELAYWKTVEDKVEIPFTYYDTAGIQKFKQTFYLCDLLMPLAVGVCLCGLFPRDRRERLDGVAFSAKYGRGRLGAAKLLAGGVSAVGVAAILFFSVLGVCVFCYGVSPNAQVQLYSASSMPITAGQELLLTFLALALYSLLCGGLVMLASLVALDAVAGLTAALAPVILDLFFSGKLDYTPLNLFQGRLFEICHLAKIGGFLFNYLQAALLVFSAGAVILFALCGLCWRRWVTAGR